MGNRSDIDRKFSDCQNIEPVRNLHGCHIQELLNGLHRAFMLDITLRANEVGLQDWQSDIVHACLQNSERVIFLLRSEIIDIERP